MTDKERDRVITGLLKLALSQKARVDDLSYQVAALRTLAIVDGMTELELDAVVASVKQVVEKASSKEAASEEEEYLRQWLENFEGPNQ